MHIDFVCQERLDPYVTRTNHILNAQINLAVYLLIVWIGRQPALSRYVRFSFQQAIILDVALVRRV